MTIDTQAVEIRPKVVRIDDEWELPLTDLKQLARAARGKDLQSRQEQRRLQRRTNHKATLVFLRLHGVDMRDIELSIKRGDRRLALRVGRQETIVQLQEQLSTMKVTVI